MRILRKLTNYISFSLLSIFLIHCGNKTTKQETNKVADSKTREASYRKIVNKDTLVVCNYSDIKNNVSDVLLSSLIDTCFIVKLESSKNAFIKYTNTIISDNYIGITNSRIPFKLFDKTGKFIRDIGKIGRGPNEYTAIYSGIIDEKENCIYLLPWSCSQILKYDLESNPLSSIKLKYDVIKAHFYISHDTITVLNLPFAPENKIAYTQKMNGQLINEISAGPRSLRPDFSNEIFSSKNHKDYVLHLSKFFGVTNDTLFYYKSDHLQPVFTIFFNDKEIPIHNYFELPDYYVCIIKDTKRGSSRSIIAESREIILVNKSTLETRKIRLKNDFCGNIEMDFTFEDGKFINNLYASDLKKKITKVLNSENGLSEERLNYLKLFNNSFSEDDNNIIFYGNIK